MHGSSKDKRIVVSVAVGDAPTEVAECVGESWVNVGCAPGNAAEVVLSFDSIEDMLELAFRIGVLSMELMAQKGK